MKKKIVTLCLIIALVATMVAGGTLAYFTDTAEATNTMTLGNIEIGVLECERVVDADGKWVPTGTTTDKYGFIPDTLQPFTPDKPLFPAVFADGDIKYDDRTTANGKDYQQSWAQVKNTKTGTAAPGSQQLFDDSVKNVIDKFVFVENTGENDAYVRVFVALEQGNIAADDFGKIIATNSDTDGEGNIGHWTKEDVATDVTIGDSEYVIVCFTYKGKTSNPNGILPAGEVSYPCLTQVYMKPEATSEQAAAIDGNGNGVYEILVFAQAVQTAGFADAQTAWETAFEEDHPWA